MLGVWAQPAAAAAEALTEKHTEKKNSSSLQKIVLLWLHISKWIGFLETSRHFSRVNKTFYKFLKHSYLKHSSKVNSGHLIVSSGQPCSLLLDIARYSVYESGLCQITVDAKKKLKGAHDMQKFCWLGNNFTIFYLPLKKFCPSLWRQCNRVREKAKNLHIF